MHIVTGECSTVWTLWLQYNHWNTVCASENREYGGNRGLVNVVFGT